MKRTILTGLATGACALLVAATTPASASKLCVVNVASWDVLNVRSEPSARSSIMTTLAPNGTAAFWSNGTCIPNSRPPGQRWCPIEYGAASGTGFGWVKARYIRAC